MSTVEQWDARIARVESACTTPIAVDGSKESCCNKAETSRPTESEKPTGPATQYRGSRGSGVQRNDAPSIGAMQAADEKPPEAPDVEMGAEDSCEAQVGLDICMLEAQDDVYDETPGTPTNPAETSGENATDEDVVAPEVTEELNRLKTLGRAHKAPSVDELMSLRYV